MTRYTKHVLSKECMHANQLLPWIARRRVLVFINLSLVLVATYYKPISPNITLLGCHP